MLIPTKYCAKTPRCFIITNVFLFVTGCSINASISNLNQASGNPGASENPTPTPDVTSKPTLKIESTTVIVNEWGVARVPVSIQPPASTDVTVNFTFTDLSAISGVDFETIFSSVTIPAGSTLIDLPISILRNYSVDSQWQFRDQIPGVSVHDVSIGSENNSLISITDDDLVPDTSFLVTGSLGDPTRIVAGAGTVCAKKSGGGFKCWGVNNAGELGLGNVGKYYFPVDFSLLNASQPAPGKAITYAIDGSGGLKCLRAAFLGDGSMADNLTLATPTGTSSGVTYVSRGQATQSGHTCAVVSGGVKCWGYGNFGQLGHGSSPTYSGSPVSPTSLGSGVTSVETGDWFSCAMLAMSCVSWYINEIINLVGSY